MYIALLSYITYTIHNAHTTRIQTPKSCTNSVHVPQWFHYIHVHIHWEHSMYSFLKTLYGWQLLLISIKTFPYLTLHTESIYCYRTLSAQPSLHILQQVHVTILCTFDPNLHACTCTCSTYLGGCGPQVCPHKNVPIIYSTHMYVYMYVYAQQYRWGGVSHVLDTVGVSLAYTSIRPHWLMHAPYCAHSTDNGKPIHFIPSIHARDRQQLASTMEYTCSKLNDGIYQSWGQFNVPPPHTHTHTHARTHTCTHTGGVSDPITCSYWTQEHIHIRKSWFPT